MQVEAANPSWDAARIVTGLRKLSYDSSSWDSLIADRAPIAALQAGSSSSGLTALQVAQFANAAAAHNAVYLRRERVIFDRRSRFLTPRSSHRPAAPYTPCDVRLCPLSLWCPFSH